MLKHEEWNENVAPLRHMPEPLAGVEIPRGGSTETTVQATLNPGVLKDIRAARNGRRLQAVLLAGTFVMMMAVPLMTMSRIGPFFSIIGLWAVLLCINVAGMTRVGRRLAALEDPRMVGPLLDVLKASGNLQKKEVKEALIRLLPRMKAHDAATLSTSQRQFLHLILTEDQKRVSMAGVWSENLKIATLKALEQVGVDTDIPVVETVAARARSRRLREAAQECLPFLRIRAAAEFSQRGLLRGSVSPDITEEILLRPVVSGPDTRPAELLRPIDRQP